MAAEIQRLRPAREVGAGHELGAPDAERARALPGGRLPQKLGHHELEHRVAEEGEPLVVRRGRMLVGVGGMGEGAEEQRLVAEAMLQAGAEREMERAAR